MFIKIFNAFVTLFTVLVILAGCVVFVPMAVGYMPLVALSGSMEPEIPTGSMIFVYTKTDPSELEVGNIVTYRVGDGSEQGAVVTHRIVEIAEDGSLLTKGDANEVQDLSPVQLIQVVGEYSYNIPQAGYIYEGIGERGRVVIAFWLVFLNVLSTILSAVQARSAAKGAEEDQEDHGPGPKKTDAAVSQEAGEIIESTKEGGLSAATASAKESEVS